MATHRHFDKICYVVLAAVLALTLWFVNAEKLGVVPANAAMGYESYLFDTSRVHTIDIQMDDWEDFLATCTDEEYADCTVVIDGEEYKDVAIRAKGNTSLTQVESYGNNRYSFKIEFDQYDSGLTYHGLDKLCLNNIIQDNTYMKDYLVYQMMRQFGVSAPLCSYAEISVNGKVWGLYLAVEAVEESFLQRNYGRDYGELYKPDSMDMGGGRGNGRDFRMDDWQMDENGSDGEEVENGQTPFDAGDAGQTPPDGIGMGTSPDGPGMGTPPDGSFDMETPPKALDEGMSGEAADGRQMAPGAEHGGGKDMGNGGSSDVALIYTDDDPDSYANIFDNAKTEITDSDQARLIASLKNINENTDLPSSVDVDEVIRYFVVHNFVLNFDSYTGSMIHNYYLYEKDGILAMIPWDYNLAFGAFDGTTDATELVNYPIDSPVSGGTVTDRPMLAWIFGEEAYTDRYHDCFTEFLTEFFDSGVFAQTVDETKALIAPYVQEDPTKFCTWEEFETGVDTLKEFCLLRAESVSGQLIGTIKATAKEQEGQEQQIDAGTLKITDMGSMGRGMGQREDFAKKE